MDDDNGVGAFAADVPDQIISVVPQRQIVAVALISVEVNESLLQISYGLQSTDEVWTMCTYLSSITVNEGDTGPSDTRLSDSAGERCHLVIAEQGFACQPVRWNVSLGDIRIVINHRLHRAAIASHFSLDGLQRSDEIGELGRAGTLEAR